MPTYIYCPIFFPKISKNNFRIIYIDKNCPGVIQSKNLEKIYQKFNKKNKKNGFKASNHFPLRPIKIFFDVPIL